MEILNSSVTLISHLIFIAMTHQVLRNLFDWSKVIKNTPENIGRLKVFILLVSIAHWLYGKPFYFEIITVSLDFLLWFSIKAIIAKL